MWTGGRGVKSGCQLSAVSSQLEGRSRAVRPTDSSPSVLIADSCQLKAGYGKWLIALAMAAAPKPLSMLTTDTPLAQLFSMASSAATPPKLAP